MKRLWLAIALLGIVIGLCVTSLLYERHQTMRLLDSLDRLEEQCLDAEPQAARKAGQAFADEFSRRTKLFACFINHSTLTDCQNNVALLPAVLENAAPGERAVEIARCRVLLTALSEVERPNGQNIL